MPNTTSTYEPLVLVDTADLPEEEWLEYRRRGIGGSDAAAILGVSPFATARDLYYDKLKVVSYEDGESNWVQKKVGHLLEDLVAEIFHVKTGFEIYQVKKMFYHPVYTYMLADIDYFMPPFYMCRSLANRLQQNGHQLDGVPGFYQKDGQWTIASSSFTAGIMIPARTRQGLISGFQIRLDVPLKNEDDPPEKDGAKYIWFSSAGKPKGTSSGSPAHFVGDPNAGVVYVTEGLLKADIAHYLMNRSFAATAGVNNMAQLEFLLKELAENGTHSGYKPYIIIPVHSISPICVLKCRRRNLSAWT